MSPRRMIPDDPEGKAIVGIMLMCLILVAVLVWVLIAIPRHARGADMELPEIITRDFGRPSNTVDAINAGRWREMCKGAARYDAMREAYELRKPDPCNGAKQWVR